MSKVLQIIDLGEKQPYEIIPWTIQASLYLPSGTVISSVAFMPYLKGGDPDVNGVAAMVKSTDFDNTTLELQVGIGDGSDGEEYRLRIRVVDTLGYRYEAEAKFKVREVQ